MAVVGCRPGKEPKTVNVKPADSLNIRHLSIFDAQQVQNVPKYTSPISHKDTTSQAQVLPLNVDAFFYHLDGINNPYFNLIPVSEVNYQQYRIIVFISSWLGTRPKIWVAFQDQISRELTRPIFTGIHVTSQAIDFHFELLKAMNPKLIEDYPNFQFYLTDISATANHGVLRFDYEIEAVISTATDWENIEEISIHSPFLRFDDVRRLVKHKPYNLKLTFSDHDDLRVQDIILDTDKDGLTDLLEQYIGTDISKNDTDNDGIEDLYDSNPEYKNIPPTEDCQIYNAIFQEFANKKLDYYTVLFPSYSKCTITTATGLIIAKILDSSRVIRFFNVRKNSDGTKAAIRFDNGIPWRSYVSHMEAYLSKTLDGWKVVSIHYWAL